MPTESDVSKSTVNRRAFLLGTGGLAAASVLPATAGAQADPFDGWFDDVPNYEGVVDATGESVVEVTVGAGDGYQFEPAAVRVDPGTTVHWEWTDAGGGHDVTAEDGSFGSEFLSGAGNTFEHTVDAEGIYPYVCSPHVTMGMKGAIVVGDAAPDAPVAGEAGGGAPGGGGSGGGGDVGLGAGIAASLAIMAVVTVAISRWIGDAPQTRA